MLTTPIAFGDILVVEDEGLIALDLEFCLKDAGARSVTVTMTLAEADQAVSLAVPDAAILDVRLPDGTSHDLARLLTRRDVPIVFHTGNSDAGALQRDFPEASILRKPSLDRDVLQAVIEAHANLRKAS